MIQANSGVERLPLDLDPTAHRYATGGNGTETS